MNDLFKVDKEYAKSIANDLFCRIERDTRSSIRSSHVQELRKFVYSSLIKDLSEELQRILTNNQNY